MHSRGKKEQLEDGDPELFGGSEGDFEPYAHYGVGNVLNWDRKRRLLLLDASPLAPSRPGCAGDQGTIGGIQVVDVLEEPEGLVHVLEERKRFHVGQYVAIWRDTRRRRRLERSHAAAVACQAELAERGVGVASVEVAAGLVWLETIEPVYRLEFDLLGGRKEKIEVQRIAEGRMLVEIAGQLVETPQAPLPDSTATIGPVRVQAVTALEDDHEGLEIALADYPGREWWR
jgi:hypothetical protein